MITPILFALLAAAAPEPGVVLAHPPFAGYYHCGEHYAGQLKYRGDALGTDCMVAELVTEDGRTWSRTHRGDGRQNDDWYGWNVELLSPCACTVVKLHLNPVTNEPGILGKPPASHVVLERADGTRFLLAHIQQPSVRVGDEIKAGEPIARVGNNGYGRMPHVHIGAWRGETPLQIRWDQREMNRRDRH
jgi:hypothetical protein